MDGELGQEMPEVTSIWFRILYAGLNQLERWQMQGAS